MNDKIGLVKLGTALVVGSGISSIISNAVKDTTPEGTSRLNKICIWSGVLVLTCMVGDKVCKYTDNAIDGLVTIINTTMVRVKEEIR